MMRLGRSAVGGVAGVACFLACAAAAQACGGNLKGPVMEHGRSPGGQSWYQVACLAGRQLEVDVSLPGPSGTDGGGGMRVPFPTSRHALYVDAPGSGFGSQRNEYEIDGVALRTTIRLELHFRSGPTRTTTTVRAPFAERRRFRYLRNVRFFVYFFTDPRGLPQTVCGVNTRGRQTSCQRVR